MAKSLGALAALLQDAELTGDANIEIKGIEHDSRKAAEGTLFVCIKGAHVDGHKFIPQAKAQGAVAIMTEEDIEAPEGMAVLKVKSLQPALEKIVPFFHKSVRVRRRPRLLNW